MNRTTFSTLFHRLLHAAHAAAVGGLVVFSAFAIFVAYVFSPAWLLPADASGTGIFAPSSAWNMELPVYPALASTSTQLGADVLRQVRQYGVAADASVQGAPVYVVDALVPLLAVLPYSCDGVTRPELAAQWQAVPVPFYAQPSDGGRMVVYQAGTDTLWEFSGMYKQADQWLACRGGMMQQASNKTGDWQSPLGVTSSGLALLGGQVSMNEYRAKRIDHAIGLSLPELGALAGWPATQNVSGVGSRSPAAGQRLQLDPLLNLDSLGLSPFGRAVALAAQKYGFIIWDEGSQVAISMESPLSATTRGAPDPYSGLSVTLANFPWDSLRALPQGYGRSGQLPVVDSFTSSASQVDEGDTVRLAWRARNVSSCSIAGVITKAAATGEALSASLSRPSSFTLACSGPNGSVSQSLAVGVRGSPAALPYVPDSALTITTNIAGQFSPIEELYGSDDFVEIYKVMYYDQENWLQTSTKPAFILDTTQLPDGDRSVRARVFFRDGTEETKMLNVAVRNQPEELILAGPLAYETISSTNSVILAVGAGLSLLVASFTGWLGWRKTRV